MRAVELNKEELALGFVAGFAFVCFLKWWVLLTAPACAFFWALSGAEGYSKFWRRMLVPMILSFSIFNSSLAGVLSYVASAAVLHIGYGIPDATDNGSWLGRYFYNHKEISGVVEATSLTRLTLAFLLWMAFLPAILWNPLWYFVAGMILIFGHVLAVNLIEGRVKVTLPF